MTTLGAFIVIALLFLILLMSFGILGELQKITRLSKHIENMLTTIKSTVQIMNREEGE